MIREPKTLDDISANREEWAQALESGKYKQAHDQLRDPDRNSFCCLGVLCDLYDSDRWEGGLYAGEDEFPPIEVTGSVGLERFGDLHFGFRDPANDAYYARANDDDASFADIAQMIRTAPFPEVPS
jgi:hypothetical protein